jgi:hypothetical protein
MNDTNDTLGLWQRLLEPGSADLLAAAGDIDPRNVASIERLRRDWPAELVAAALQLAAARRAARSKFPQANELIADVAGVEQATSHLVAEHKALRFQAIAPTRVVDLCCGIGGDAMSLVRVADVLAIDQNPLRAWMCDRNAGCATEVADVSSIELSDEVVHLDPARRVESGARKGRRAWQFEDYEPGPAFIADLLRRCPDAAIKLGPGVDLDALPAAATTEIELITERGTLVQAVLWSGRLARQPGGRSATCLPEGFTIRGEPTFPDVSPGGRCGRFLLVPDAAAERSGLLGTLAAELGATEVHPGLGLLTADAVEPTPWVHRFEVIEQMPFRPRRLRAWLATHGAGVVEVKTRGRAVDPDSLQRTLRGRGEAGFTVFVLRLGRRLVAVITRRVA